MTVMLTETRPSVEEANKAVSEGMKIGEGAYRMVYRLPGSDWVYKVSVGFYGGAPNEDEYENYRHIIKSPEKYEGFNIPETVLLDNGMIAQRYIKGNRAPYDCSMAPFSPEYYRCTCKDEYGFSECWYSTTGIIEDNHSGNVIISTNGDGGFDIWVIDLNI